MIAVQPPGPKVKRTVAFRARQILAACGSDDPEGLLAVLAHLPAPARFGSAADEERQDLLAAIACDLKAKARARSPLPEADLSLLRHLTHR